MNLSPETLLKTLKNVINMLECSADSLRMTVHMPFAEPDNPVWEEFLNQPYVWEFINIFSAIHDAKLGAEKTMHKINSDTKA